jgi:hypothetical protein
MIAAMSAPLISPAWRTRAVWVCVVAAIAFGALAALVAGTHSNGFDDWMFRELYRHTGGTFAQATLDLSRPAVSISVCVLTAIAAAVARRWNIFVLAGLGPGGTVLLAKYVFKPLLGRVFSTDDVYRALLIHPPDALAYSYHGTFPSGHESAVASAACMLAIACFHVPISRRVRIVVLALLAAWTLVAAIGLVRNFWHYATDTIGAIFFAVVVVVAVAFAVDRYLPSGQQWLARRSANRDQLTWRS